MTDTYRYDPSGLHRVFDHHFTFLAGFERNVHRFAGHLALAEPSSGRTWTYAELGESVERFAGALAELGAGPGSVVSFQLYNTPEFVLCYLGAQRVGAIASPINFRFASGETAHVLDDSRPHVLVYDDSLAEEVHLARTLARWEPPVVVRAGAMAGAGDTATVADLLAWDTRRAPRADVTCWDESTRLYTSGTTGRPKGVSLPSVAEVLTAHDVIMHLPLTPEDRTLNMTPWFHRGGISPGGPNSAFYVGAAAITMRNFDAATCLDLVEAHGITWLIGAPTNLAMLAAEQETRPRDLFSLRGIVTMGAPLERTACLRYQKVLTTRIFNGYGTTEAFWNTFLRPTDLPERAGTAGRACTDDDVAVVRVYDDRLADPNDTVAMDGTEVGEVIMRSVKSGYAYVNLPDQEAARFRDGWLYTGDLATWDNEEFVTIVGRKDDMILSGGENVHPVQVEEILNEHPLVADSIVVGMPDPLWGEVVVAYVQPSGEGLGVADCEAHCRDHPMLSDYKRPRAYRFVDSLPRTATGKKMHYVVREEVRRAETATLLERP